MPGKADGAVSDFLVFLIKDMKHAKKINRRTRQKKLLNVLLAILAVVLVVLAVTIYRDYQARPGFLEKIWISDRGADYITVSWERPRNIYKYVITYNDKTISVSGMRKEMRLTNLEEDTDYTISVRADSHQRKGFKTLTEHARTKKKQSIAGDNTQMKFVNTLVDLRMDAETELTYLSSNKNMKIEGDKVMFTRPGKYIVTVKTSETSEYAAATKKITVNVLDSVNVDADGAAPHVFYRLNSDNCELKMSIRGVKEGNVPQSFEYLNGKYYVLYVVKGNKTQRIISFGGKKTVYKPKMDLGHSNGLTVADGTFYEVNGRGPDGVSFDPSNKNYKSFSLPYNASGIAYDEMNQMFYTSQLNGMTTYDKNFNVVNHFGRIYRSGTHYAQDSAAYKGVLMHCVSGKDPYGLNYIDFYDMLHQKYMGSIECNLSEVESILVNDDGYLELLCNTKSNEDYIWKTPINVKMLLD